MRIRAPSRSSSLSTLSSCGSFENIQASRPQAASAASTSNRVSSRKIHPTIGNIRRDTGPTRAGKKAHARREHTKLAQWAYVYIGNLSPSATEAELVSMFEPHCGPIKYTCIRVADGLAIPEETPGFLGLTKGLTGIHYASLHFEDPTSVARALEMNGFEYRGRKLIVTVDTTELPETLHALQDILAKKRAKKIPPTLMDNIRGGVSNLKRLTIQRTELAIKPQSNPGVARPRALKNALERTLTLFPGQFTHDTTLPQML